mmetsp:Transcript_13008/g.26563  ORF Transcript_13008/g.26563 Transcript_13008/m.26563 type:complete len:82 (-) Transcript_13008:55-300(-)
MSNVSSLYRALLREGRQFADYNVSSYILRSVRVQFREPPAESIETSIQFGHKQLELLKRQRTLSQFFPSGDNVMEKLGKSI